MKNRLNHTKLEITKKLNRFQGSLFNRTVTFWRLFLCLSTRNRRFPWSGRSSPPPSACPLPPLVGRVSFNLVKFEY
jgi:hypothetical protein